MSVDVVKVLKSASVAGASDFLLKSASVAGASDFLFNCKYLSFTFTSKFTSYAHEAFTIKCPALSIFINVIVEGT